MARDPFGPREQDQAVLGPIAGQFVGSARLPARKELADRAEEFRLWARRLGRSLCFEPRPEAETRRLRRKATPAMLSAAHFVSVAGQGSSRHASPGRSGGNVTGAEPSKALVSLVEDDGEPARNAELGGDINPRRVPFAPFLDQQRRTAVASGPRAVVP